MPKLSCPGCSKLLNVDDKYQGRRVKCPVCKGAIDVPSTETPTPKPIATSKSDAKIEVQCFCGQSLRAPISRAGQTINCPKCQLPLTIPDPNAQDASKPAPLDVDFFGSAMAQVPAAGSTAKDKADNDFWNAALAPPASAAAPENSAPMKPALANPYSDMLTAAEADAVSRALAVNNKSDDFSGRNYAPIMVCVLLIFIGPFMTVTGCKEKQDVALLASEGEQVTGVIMEASTSRSRRSTKYYFDVTYVTKEGESFSDSFSVSSAVFRQHCNMSEITDDKVSVTYARSKPSVARLAGDTKDPGMMMNIGIFLTAVGVIGTALFGWMLTR